MQFPPLANAALTLLQSQTQPSNGQTATSMSSGIMQPIEPLEPEVIGAEDEMFSVHHIDPVKFKVHLFERVGEAFGLNADDFDDITDMARAIKGAIMKIMLEPDGIFVISEIEKDIGLDDLGVSLDTVIKAMIDPGSSADERLDAAISDYLEEKFGEEALEDAKLYSPFTAAA